MDYANDAGKVPMTVDGAWSTGWFSTVANAFAVTTCGKAAEACHTPQLLLLLCMCAWTFDTKSQSLRG